MCSIFFDGFGNVLLENEFWCKNDYCMDLKHHQNNTKHHKNTENTPKFSDRLRRPEIPTIGMKNHRNFFLGQKTIGIFYFYSYGSYGSMGVNHILVKIQKKLRKVFFPNSNALSLLFLNVTNSYLESNQLQTETFESEQFQTLSLKSE